MKEATGELNMTVVTIVAITALVAFFYLAIWPQIKKSMEFTAACNASNNGRSVYSADTNGDKEADVFCHANNVPEGSCGYSASDYRSCE